MAQWAAVLPPGSTHKHCTASTLWKEAEYLCWSVTDGLVPGFLSRILFHSVGETPKENSRTPFACETVPLWHHVKLWYLYMSSRMVGWLGFTSSWCPSSCTDNKWWVFCGIIIFEFRRCGIMWHHGGTISHAKYRQAFLSKSLRQTLGSVDMRVESRAFHKFSF